MSSYFGLIGIITIVFALFSRYKPNISIVSIVLFGLFLRLFTTLFFSHSLSSDIYSFLITGNVLLQKVPIFPSVYFPFIFYLGALSLIVSSYIPPLLFLKIIFSFFDVGVIYMIYKIAKNPYPALLYASHPAMIIIVTIHGQLDSLPLFFFLFSVLMMQRKKEKLSAVALGIAISIKPWPVIFLPTFIKKSTHKMYYLSSVGIPLATAVFHSLITRVNLIEILTPIKNYRGIYGIWGIGSIMFTLFPLFWEQYIQLFRRIFLVSFTLWQCINHKKTFFSELVLSVLVFFAFSPLFGAQWLSWIIPFLCIIDTKPIIRTVLITLYISLSFLSDLTPEPIWRGTIRDYVVNGIGLFVWLSLWSLFLSYRKSLLNCIGKKFVCGKNKS